MNEVSAGEVEIGDLLLYDTSRETNEKYVSHSGVKRSSDDSERVAKQNVS